MKHFILSLIVFCCCFSCGKSYSPEIEEVLKQAGKNRSELEKVLRHYAQNPSDSLKLRAAEFLTVNMPGKYSEYYDAPWNDLATACLRWTSSSDKQRVVETYKLGKPVMREDVKYITADYLINNIELAFQSWQDKPWGKYVSFDTFCEEILPYRINIEPLENWREKALTSFADMNKELSKDSAITATGACDKVNGILPKFRMDKDFPVMSYSQLMATTRGLCSEEAALTVFVMRALGIPVTIDFTPQWTNMGIGHEWNSVCDSSGNHIAFMGTERGPYESPGEEPITKAYRKTFARNRIVRADKKDIPPLFNENIKDVSAGRRECVDIKIPVKYQPKKPTGYAYLALLYDFQWRIIGYGNVDSDTVNFPSVGKKGIYLPVYYTDGKQYSAGDPFLIEGNGNVVSFDSDSPDSLMSFSAITPDDGQLFDRMIGGVFEGADKPDFSDAKTIHTINRMPDMDNSVILSKTYKYRYVRYITLEQRKWCNVSEIEFSGISGKKLEGKHIGSAGSHKNLGQTGDKAFDGDITTFYDAAEDPGAWTGLDLGEQQEITAIRYMPRVMGYGIYAGHEYELFCWSEDSWQSSGKQTATDVTLSFKAPSKALFYLYNHTTKTKGKLFFVSKEQIVFY